MSDKEPSSLESKKALDRVERELKEAKRIYADENNLEDAEEHAVAAQKPCDQMASGMGSSLSPLVDDVAEAIGNTEATEQVEALIGNALAQVQNLRLSLGSVEGQG